MLQPGQLRESEKPEFVFRGPFGGIQAEMPPHLIEQLIGLTDSTNILFKHGFATVRPGFTSLGAFPAAGPAGEQINGIVNFYNLNGNLIQVVITAAPGGGGRLLLWNGPATGFTVITNGGAAFTGTNANQFVYDSIGYKLAFCNGVDPIQLWDGVAGSFNKVTDVNAPTTCRFLAEIANHLVAAYTTEGGTTRPQRLHWSATGDPTDWTSFSAGINDRLTNFGPITGMIKQNQIGFGFQQKGIFQIIPTGIGTNPFFFQDLGNRARGNIAPLSLDVYNETYSFYLGLDNVYGFNGTSSEQIGEAPLQGRSRQGAWGRIVTDVQAVNPATIVGVVTDSINGRRYNAYWLFIPGVSCWVFNIDEANWTRYTFGKTVSRAEFFTNNGIIRIVDLVGTIASQTWTPATLQSNNPFDDFLIGFTDGTPGLVDFTNSSETPFNLTTGPMIMGDARHEKKVDAVRIIYQDQGKATFNLVVSNEKGETRSPVGGPVTIGTGTGAMATIIVTIPPITGMYITVNINGAAGQPLSISELTPLLEVANEYKQNVA